MNARAGVGLDNVRTRYKVLVATLDGRERLVGRRVDECEINDRPPHAANE